MKAKKSFLKMTPGDYTFVSINSFVMILLVLITGYPILHLLWLSLSGKAAALVREMASFVPGNLYLHADGETLHVFFRGRFVGFSINPLMNLSERILRANPLPEAEQALRLALMLAAGHERNG